MRNTKISIQNSNIQFGTSGARGLVNDFTPEVCAAFTKAFIYSLETAFEFNQVAIAIDNRPSSMAIAKACANAITSHGLTVIFYGVIPTPALAYSAMQDEIPCIMVTGSHIPFDRNGLKFYRPDGEISKLDEERILNAEAEFQFSENLAELIVSDKAKKQYIERYTSVFDENLLQGKRIGIFEHSSAGRDLYKEIFTALGANVFSLERTSEFVAIDTEAVSEADKIKALQWAKAYDLDFIFSTDGDGDRPLVSNEKGEWLRGDILGLLCADALQIEALAVPISVNTIVETVKKFKRVAKTKIGSPYVIAELSNLSEKFNTIAGFEANGGFLLGSDILLNGKLLKALPTRDAILPALMLLYAAKSSSIENLVNALPKRFTYSNRIQNFPIERGRYIIELASIDTKLLLKKLNFENIEIKNVNKLDGVRFQLSDDSIIHFRPSGNAPEFRCYAEASSLEKAQTLVDHMLNKVLNF